MDAALGVRQRPYLPPLDRNGRLVLAAKAVRSFAFGLNAVVLGVYMAELRLSGPEIGLVLSSALLGSTALTLAVALWGDRIGRRRLLAWGAALMTLTLLIPVAGGNPAVLVLVGLSGMVAVTANESTGLQSVDQAVLPATVPPTERTAAFAVYNLVASVASAFGGLSVAVFIAAADLVGLSGTGRYAPAFIAYGAAGVVALVLARQLDARAETAGRVERRFGVHRSRRAVAELSLLFGVDSLASGFIVQSFLALWFTTRFGFEPAALGALFFAANLLTAASYPVAAWLAARIGLVRTMVFTHIPASLFLIAMAVVPSAPLAALLFLARASLSSMDVPARQSYTMAIVDPDERTATAGVTNLAKSSANAVGPLLAGALLVPLGLAAPLVACGVVKIGYDLALFVLFRSRPAPEETLAAAEPSFQHVPPDVPGQDVVRSPPPTR